MQTENEMPSELPVLPGLLHALCFPVFQPLRALAGALLGSDFSSARTLS